MNKFTVKYIHIDPIDFIMLYYETPIHLQDIINDVTFTIIDNKTIIEYGDKFRNYYIITYFQDQIWDDYQILYFYYGNNLINIEVIELNSCFTSIDDPIDLKNIQEDESNLEIIYMDLKFQCDNQ